MIFKNLTALCRQHKAIRLFGDPDELQWVSEGHAMYPLHGHPGMTAEVLPQLFDVREKDLGKYIIKHEIRFWRLSVQQRLVYDLEVGSVYVKCFVVDHQLCKSRQIFFNFPIHFVSGKRIDWRSHLRFDDDHHRFAKLVLYTVDHTADEC